MQILPFFTFAVALAILLLAAKFFTQSAEKIGAALGLSSFVIGVFIVGVGTSLPELISGAISVRQGASEIVPGNISGANIANLLLITGVAVILNRKQIVLSSGYIYVDLHFLLGGVFSFVVISADGKITFFEALFGGLIFLVYSFYLIRQGNDESDSQNEKSNEHRLTIAPILVLLAAGVGIYIGAEFTVSSLTQISDLLRIPKSIAALTILSLGTTLPELAVIIAAIKQGKAELAIGNVLGSAVFNTLAIPAFVSIFGTITVPATLMQFSIPALVASSVLFYLLTQDKKVTTWEGYLLVLIYCLFLAKIAGL